MYQDIIDKLISITDTIPWFRACADTNMMYDEDGLSKGVSECGEGKVVRGG